MAEHTVVHMCVDIKGCLKNWTERQLAGMFRNDDGSKATGKQVKAYLLDQLSLGRKVLPTSSDCEGFDYQIGCPGHVRVDEASNA